MESRIRGIFYVCLSERENGEFEYKLSESFRDPWGVYITLIPFLSNVTRVRKILV